MGRGGGLPPGLPPGRGRLLGGLGLTLGVVGLVTSSGGVKLGSSSAGGGAVEEVEEGNVVSFPSLISFSNKSMKGSVETGLISGRGGGCFVISFLFVFIFVFDSFLLSVVCSVSSSSWLSEKSGL